MTPNCPCDERIFPPRKTIPAGLSDIPRQLATFPEFRSAMLAAIGGNVALSDWRARSNGVFGIMLLEMWAYVCDGVTFYDQVLGNEHYIRSATQRPSLRRLAGLLGYLPRPAVGATVHLAILAEGRTPITLPAGTQFRSGSFPGGTPQVFEMEAPAKVHPLLNRWSVQRRRPQVLAGATGAATVAFESLLIDPKTLALKTGQYLLLEIQGDPAHTAAREILDVADFSPSVDEKLKKVSWSGAVSWPGTTPMAAIRLSFPAQRATLWKIPESIPTLIATESTLIGSGSTIITLLSAVEHFGIYGLASGTRLFFDTLYRDIRLGSRLILEKEGELRWFRVASIGETTMELPGGTTAAPAPKVPVTWVGLDTGLNDPSRIPVGAPHWSNADANALVVHYGMQSAGKPLEPFFPNLNPGDPINLTTPFESPTDGSSTNTFQLEDKDGSGVEITGDLTLSPAKIVPAQTSGLTGPLLEPVTVYGNIVAASRGETVAIEVLGVGDASAAYPSFTLKKKPLTYLAAASSDNEQGVRSTLRIYAAGLLWSEVPSFYGVAPGSQVYIVRHDDDQNSTITFASPVQTGASIVAMYRFGAEKISPPSGSITQPGKPVKGLQAIKNPVAAAGGDDQELSSGIQKYGPRSALLLGRAISVQDMEAAAATAGGVRAAKAEWRWHEGQQRPVVQIWYIGAASIRAAVSQKLRNLTDPAAPIAVDQAVSVPSSLAIAIAIDPRYIEEDVLPQIRAALMNPDTGLLAPELIGIGAALFRSRIFDVVLGVPGAAAVHGLTWNGGLFTDWGIQAGSGVYFDLEAGSLILNGKASDA